MLEKIDVVLTFDSKRHRNIITPCCKSLNRDGKFVTYKELPLNYGYCHSCGKATLPPTRYRDDSRNEFIWNDITKKKEPFVANLNDNDVIRPNNSFNDICNTLVREKKFIDFESVRLCFNNTNENNLLIYLRTKYGDKKTDIVKRMYYIGTSRDLGTVFWSINRAKKAQKAKVSYYKPNGRRTNHFKVPYKNEDGYYSCLFGEHLLDVIENKEKAVMLVESEKTAIVCAMHYPEYIWLAYGGITALTNEKIQVLIGRKVILIPDMSEKAVAIMTKKISEFEERQIDVKIWDLTYGKTDKELMESGWYNSDLEDVLRTDKTI